MDEPVPPDEGQKVMTMNARIASADIRYPHTQAHGLKVELIRPLPTTLQTENLRIELIQKGAVCGAALPGGYPAADNSIVGGMWAIFTHRGDPLGFIALDEPPVLPEYDCYYGPRLDIACLRDDAYAPYVPEAIAGLFDWLRAHNICFAIHADHVQSDQQLADWLIGAGFLYTGCHCQDGRQQMICLL